MEKDSIQSFVSFSYFLEGSLRYKKFKNFFYNLFENENYKYKKYFDIFMILIILSSVTILVIDVKEHIPQWIDDFDLYFVTSIFIIEYLIRLWLYSDIHKMIIEAYENSLYFEHPINKVKLLGRIVENKIEYMISLPAIIDLIAILPSYRGIRIFRVLVLFRAFKMFRYTKSLTGFLYVLKNKKYELMTLFILFAFFIFMAGTMLYVFEGASDNKNIHNLFDAFYWALITISTVGYGDITPITTEGKAVSMLIVMVGLGLISLITSVIVSSFSEKLTSLRKDRVIHELGKKKDLSVICGFGLLGKLVAKDLKNEGIDFVVLDNNEEKALQASNMGYKSICADASKSEIFESLKIDAQISHVLCLTSDDVQNSFIAINVKSLKESVDVTVRCSDQEIANKLKSIGINKIIIPEEIAGMMAAVYAGEPVAFKVLLSIIEEKERTQIDEVRVDENCFLDGALFGDVDFEDLRLIILGIFRRGKSNREVGNFIFNPNVDFKIKAGDDLVCIGYTIAIANLKQKVQSDVW